MKKIPLSDASKAELQSHCDMHGLAYDGRLSEGSLRSLIAQSGWEKDYIEVPDEGAPAPKAASHASGGGVITIVIPKTETDTNDVFLSCNEESWMVRRGVPAQIPLRAYESLKNSSRSQAVTDSEGQIIDWITVPGYPHSVLA